MKRYKINILSTARADEKQILQYLRGISPAVTKLYQQLFASELRSLSELPLRCPPARDETLAERGYRYLVVRHYLVFFTVADDTVTIRRIVDGRGEYII